MVEGVMQYAISDSGTLAYIPEPRELASCSWSDSGLGESGRKRRTAFSRSESICSLEYHPTGSEWL